jgi:hypothetical protein
MSEASAPRPQRDPLAIEEKLRAALEAAREREATAGAEFRSATADPSSISTPDRLAELKNAAEDASEAYLLALRRFGTFVINGIVPDDLG